MNKTAVRGLVLAAVASAVLFRAPELRLRPMHHDEANQALKFGALLENGEYRYDKADHHGPSLYYLSLPVAAAAGRKTLASLDETVLRLVPAGFGIGVVLLFLFFAGGMGRSAAAWSALFAAVSPVMVYYSRFYIQEMLLVFFLVGFLALVGRYMERPRAGRALGAGFFAGMMYATKETSVLLFGAAACAAALTALSAGRHAAGGSPKDKPRLWHFAAAATAALAVVWMFYSSFFANPEGFLDSVLSFKVYFERAGEAGWHTQPWHYYLSLLAFSKAGGGPVWSEALILVLAAAGSIFLFRKRLGYGRSPGFMRFVFFYAVVSAAVFSLIPYKTPWNLLPFYAGFLLLAGFGAASLIDCLSPSRARFIILIILAAGSVHLGYQSWRGNDRYFADPRNPYVYAQTGTDFMKLVDRVNGLAGAHPDGTGMLIKVIAGPYETWPLPWYLRRFARVGYWTDAEAAGGFEGASAVICSQEEAEKLDSRLRDRFQPEYYGLRPGVLLSLYVEEGLWKRFLGERSE